MVSGSRLTVGDMVDGFEVEGLLQRGGTSEVYVAREAATGARVALKVLVEVSAAEVARFEREGQLAAGLDHPHIVAGRGHGRGAGGVAWIAMELLEGEDLSERLARAPLPFADVLALGMQVCDALAFAHARGIVHRDIKPSNLFLCAGAAMDVKVLDFGVARLADARGPTRTGFPVGTFAYMSPEQTRGARDVDARSDLWSLGAVLYECLAGRGPFQAASGIGYVFQIREAVPADLGALVPNVPRSLVDIVHRALDKAREERPPSADAMRAALATVELPAPSAAPHAPARRAAVTALESTLASEAEVRLASVVCVRGARDAVFVEAVARELGGRVETLLSGEQLVLFGVDRWFGDEPSRAVRLSLGVAPAARGVGVATGRVLHSTVATAGAVVDAAATLARDDGITLDAATASAVRGEFALAAGAGGAARVDARAPRPEPTTRAAEIFVGRDVELGVLLKGVEAAAQEQRTRVTVVLGAAGMGKSRLHHEALARLPAGAGDPTCLAVRCEAARRDAPFAALRDALARVVDPSVAAVFAPAGPGGGDPVAALDRARASLETVLAGLAGRGVVVLVIDDAQWLDPSSRSTLRWILQNAPDLPLAVWAFARPEARESVLDALPGASVLELGPLSPADAGSLLNAVAGAAPEALLERAGGHPLFLEELGRHWRERGAGGADDALPLSVEGAHLAQLDRAAAPEREFLKRAAVLGRTWWAEAVASLGGDPGAMPGLRRAGLVVPRARSRFDATREFTFRAGTLQEVAYGLWPEAPRRELHARAARWLAGRAGALPEEVARHWELADERSCAAEAFADAAEAAARLADAAATRAHAAKVLALTGSEALRWRALSARDDVLQLGDDLDLQREGLDALTSLAEGLDARHRVEAAWRRCYFARVTSDIEGALEAGQRALALTAAIDEPRWGATVNIEVALLLGNLGRHGEAVAHATAARAAAGRCGEPWLAARAVATLAYVMAETGDPGAVLGWFEAAADGFASAGDRRRESLMRSNVGAALLLLGRLDEAASAFASAIESSRRVGNAPTAAVATHNLGVVRRVLGDLDGARALQDQAAAAGARLGHARLASSVATERAWLALASADVDAFDGLAAEALRLAESTRSPALVAAARAAALRLVSRGGAPPAELLAASREAASAAAGEEARAALRASIWEAGGRRDDDRALALEALAALAPRVTGASDRARCVEAFCRRYRVPDELSRLTAPR